nr:hypothetical protein [Tanacetum cinerariifolium]
MNITTFAKRLCLLIPLFTAPVAFAAEQMTPSAPQLAAKAYVLMDANSGNVLVTVSDLLHGIIIQSGNDASVALSEHIAGSEDAFADMMNKTAGDLGMVNSHFMNPTGLPNPDHYATAHDMALLARAIIHEDPAHYAIYSQK